MGERGRSDSGANRLGGHDEDVGSPLHPAPPPGRGLDDHPEDGDDAPFALGAVVRSSVGRLLHTTAEAADDAIDAALAEIGDLLAVDRVYVFRVDDDGAGTITNTHEWCAPGITPEIDNLVGIPLEEIHAWLGPFRRGEHIQIADVASLPEDRRAERELLEPQGIRSLLVVPMLSLGELVGFVGFDSVARHRRFGSIEVETLRIAADAVVAVETRRRFEARLVHDARHDVLTGLANRVALEELLADACLRASAEGTSLGLAFLDLDQFKLVNDTHGHRVGDHLLQAVADRLSSAVRPGDLVSRFGGDEFVVLLRSLADETDLGTRCDALRASLARPTVVDGIRFSLAASVGVASSLDGDPEPDLLLRDADTAMYRSKERGRDRLTVFDAELRATVVRRAAVVNRLPQALAGDRIHVHVQPIVDLLTGVRHGFECLARWDDDELGTVGPDEFVPAAEDSGAIHLLGATVLAQAARLMAVHPRQMVGINLSAAELAEDGLVERITSTVTEVPGAALGRLVVEITESAVIHDLDLAAATLQELVDLGVWIGMDDFGTGYATLAALRRLPIGMVKVDRDFLTDAVHDPVDRRMLRTLVELCDDVGAVPLAEGIETEEQHRLVVDLGFRYGQGYRFGRPMPPDLLPRDPGPTT